MIRYTLQCPEGHRFDSWFRDGGAFDALSISGGLACPECGSVKISKSLMTPQVRPARAKAEHAPAPGAQPPADAPARFAPAPFAPETERERALAAFKARVEAEADYVGLEFASEARAMHAGDTPERPIYGEAKPADAKALIEEGVPVAPLPFLPTRKVN
ncbi:MAG: DUF1178 family protein [Maritimibacter sp.]|nr:DUF1178 family protein [Maritimibacter sp.]